MRMRWTDDICADAQARINAGERREAIAAALSIKPCALDGALKQWRARTGQPRRKRFDSAQIDGMRALGMRQTDVARALNVWPQSISRKVRAMREAQPEPERDTTILRVVAKASIRPYRKANE